MQAELCITLSNNQLTLRWQHPRFLARKADGVLLYTVQQVAKFGIK